MRLATQLDAPLPSSSTREGRSFRGALWRRRLTMMFAAFGGLTALAGGTALVGWGGTDAFPLSLLAPTAFHSFLIPGLLLAVVVGGSCLGCALLSWKRARAAIDATLFAGGVMTVWIVAEVAQLREFSWLQVLYGALGLALLGVGIDAAWASAQPRHRWVVAVTLAETVGFLFPISAMVFLGSAGPATATAMAIVVGAGLAEGLALGTGQALALDLPISRLRFALLTSLGAGVAWAAILGSMQLLETGGPLQIAAAALLGLAGLSAVAIAQWLELRRHRPSAHRWVGWTMLAWAVALPLSFLPSPLFDASTPAWAQLSLLACGGTLMAYVMAMVTWVGVRSLRARLN